MNLKKSYFSNICKDYTSSQDWFIGLNYHKRVVESAWTSVTVLMKYVNGDSCFGVLFPMQSRREIPKSLSYLRLVTS